MILIKSLMNSKFVVLLSFILLFSFFIVGCGNGDSEVDNGSEPLEEEIYQEGKVKIYFTEDTGTRFSKAFETREVEKITPLEAMELYMEGPEEESLIGVAGDVQLLGVEVEEDLAEVDFSSELLEIPHGHESESVFVDTIVYTLTEFEAIDRVQILVEGDKVDSISGHKDISEPLGR